MSYFAGMSPFGNATCETIFGAEDSKPHFMMETYLGAAGVRGNDPLNLRNASRETSYLSS